MPEDRFEVRVLLNDVTMSGPGDVAQALRGVADRVEERGLVAGPVVDYLGDPAGGYGPVDDREVWSLADVPGGYLG